MEGRMTGCNVTCSSMEVLEGLTNPEALRMAEKHGEEAEPLLSDAEDADWGELSDELWQGKDPDLNRLPKHWGADWNVTELVLGTGGTYFEYYCAQENMFYYSNPDTGHTTWDEPDEQEFDIARYHDKLGVGDWSPPHRDAPPPAEDSEEFFTISAVVSRECSMTSMASLRSSPRKVDLVHPTGYRALLNHLRDEPSTQLAQWRERQAVVDGMERGAAPLGQGCASIQGEIPDLADVDEVEDLAAFVSGREPRGPKKSMLQWGLLACSVVIMTTMLLRR